MTAVHHRFLRYRASPGTQPLVGLVSEDETKVTSILNSATGFPYSELFDLIEDHPDVPTDYRFQLVSGSEKPVLEVEKLAPLTGRDILCIGKNYTDHAKEFNQSGFDASDKKDQPEFPVFFTKRASSIVPDGHPIYLHPTVSSSVDYEGELGIIIGKGGIQIKQADAWKHVWGAVIINDVTARERQRDHKQFFIGKSLDTFCPMGAYVIPSSSLSWKDLHLTTKVNGEIRQSQNTSELIFDVPSLIESASMGITLQPGDVIATGTPYGTGMSLKTWLKEGDIVEISIPPLGVLKSPVAPPTAAPFILDPVRSVKPQESSFPANDSRLLTIGPSQKQLHVEVSGSDNGPAVLFFHGLGATLQSYKAAVDVAGLSKKSKVILFDLEGHGQSPLSVQAHRGLSIAGFAEDGKAILDALNIKQAHIVGHSMGGLIATTFAALYPDLVMNLVLIGPALNYWPEKKQGLRDRAALAYSSGMSVVAEKLAGPGLSKATLSSKPLVKVFVEQSLASSPSAGYILACLALVAASDPDFSRIKAENVVILAGREDEVIPKRIIDFSLSTIKGVKIIWMEDVGHWHMLENIEGTAKIFTEYLV
ncbi:hypothetical protein M422DRAFT_65578 [Sphaerobolus stellatus SS14]|nr:hypothetical protein M422DRAFT_65578 [Sphaerobolus stellatus SS14]